MGPYFVCHKSCTCTYLEIHKNTHTPPPPVLYPLMLSGTDHRWHNTCVYYTLDTQKKIIVAMFFLGWGCLTCMVKLKPLLPTMRISLLTLSHSDVLLPFIVHRTSPLLHPTNYTHVHNTHTHTHTSSSYSVFTHVKRYRPQMIYHTLDTKF